MHYSGIISNIVVVFVMSLIILCTQIMRLMLFICWQIDATNPHSFAVDQCKSASVNKPPPMSPWFLMYFLTINQL